MTFDTAPVPVLDPEKWASALATFAGNPAFRWLYALLALCVVAWMMVNLARAHARRKGKDE